MDVYEKEGGAVIELSSDVFTKGVFIDFDNCDPVLSDNFFDIVNKEKVRIDASTDVSAEELKKQIRIKTVYDIGK